MHYFIDGYNLMFRFSRAGGDLQKRRQEIIEELESKINAIGLDVTLVFDAQYQNTESSRSHILQMEICFTNVGETADEFILQALKEGTRPHLQTVVTSDKKLAWLARRRHANTETVEEFFSFLNRRYKNKLQQKKQLKKIIPPIPKKSSTAPKSPAEEIPAENCFDFYLNQFQKSFDAAAEEKNAKKEARKLKAASHLPHKRKPKTVPKKVDDEQSLLLRWMAAFQRDVNVNDY